MNLGWAMARGRVVGGTRATRALATSRRAGGRGRVRGSRGAASGSGGEDSAGESKSLENLKSALNNARTNLDEQTSPGAGLESAEEQAEAAFADLLLTSLDDGREADLSELAESGTMPEEATGRKSKNWLGDMQQLFGALAGGAHIVKKEDGRV